MTRALVVGDSGPAMARHTECLRAFTDVAIVRYASASGHVNALLLTHGPDLVVIEVRRPALALARAAEALRTVPAAAVVVLAAWPEGDWAAKALRMGAAAVLPDDVNAATLHRVIEEVLAAPRREVATVHELRPRRPRRRRAGALVGEPPTKGRAA